MRPARQGQGVHHEPLLAVKRAHELPLDRREADELPHPDAAKAAAHRPRARAEGDDTVPTPRHLPGRPHGCLHGRPH